MKRLADHEENSIIRPAKQRRDNQYSPITPDDYFSGQSEVNLGALAVDPLDDTGYIVGQVFMLWPATNKSRKIQLKMGFDSLDIVFEGTGLDKLDFLSRDKLQISLKGCRKEVKKAGSPHTLPFKLVFSNGVLVKFLKSEKRQEDKIVDLFEREINDDDWFCSPAEDSNILDAVQNASTLLPVQDDLADVSHENVDIQNSDLRPLQVSNNSVSEPGADETTTHYIHRIGAGTETIHSHSAKPSVVPDATIPTSHVDSSSTSGHTTGNSNGSRNKAKRIKKKDTRHSTADANSNNTDQGTTNLRGKKAKKRVAQARAEAVQQKSRLSTSPAPHRDPALDLVAGFTSEKGDEYTPIGNVASGATCNLVGVVIDSSPAKRTRTGDFIKSIILVDPSTNESQILTINLFAEPKETALLPSAVKGQILLLRRIKCKEFNGKPQGTGYKDSFQWCGYDPAQGRHFYSETDPAGQFFDPSTAEMEYFVKLADWWRALKELEERMQSNDTNNDPSIGSITHIASERQKSREKLRIISQLEPNIFVDCVVKLLKVWKGDVSSDIYVTDYSENERLQLNDQDDTFPLGRRTLKVSLWDGAHAMVDELELNSYYLLTNMRLKCLHQSRIYLEGSIGYAERGIDKLGKESDRPDLRELQNREKEYRSNPKCSEPGPVTNAYVSEVGEPMCQGHEIVPPVRMNHEEVNNDIQVAAGVDSGSVLDCRHMDQKQSTIEEVQRSSRCPNKFRVRARIIEYYPLRIEDFVTAECNDCHKILDCGHSLCPECGDLTGRSVSVRYQFALRIGDESGSELNVNVSDFYAEELLSGLDPKDAREDVDSLKRRLVPLIGHLEKWHTDFEEGSTTEGSWLDMCLSSWVSETAEGESIRLYKLFGCTLQLL